MVKHIPELQFTMDDIEDNYRKKKQEHSDENGHEKEKKQQNDYEKWNKIKMPRSRWAKINKC